jgi:hypothetical protein
MNTFCRRIRIRSEAFTPIDTTQVVTFVNFLRKMFIKHSLLMGSRGIGIHLRLKKSSNSIREMLNNRIRKLRTLQLRHRRFHQPG